MRDKLTDFRWGFESFYDGLGDLRTNKDEERVGESGFRAGEPRAGEEPVRSEAGPVPEEGRALQRFHPNRAAEFPPVAVRGPDEARLWQEQAHLEEKALWRWANEFICAEDEKVSSRFLHKLLSCCLLRKLIYS